MILTFLLWFLWGFLAGAFCLSAGFVWLVVREFNNAHRMYRSARMVQEAYTGGEEE